MRIHCCRIPFSPFARKDMQELCKAAQLGVQGLRAMVARAHGNAPVLTRRLALMHLRPEKDRTLVQNSQTGLEIEFTQNHSIGNRFTGNHFTCSNNPAF